MFDWQTATAPCACDGISRRNLLRVGTLALGGLTLADRLRLEAQGALTSRKNAAVIFVFLAGGPSHMETFDPKPDAAQDYRGPLGTIRTRVPGVQFGELVPKLAGVMDKVAVLRSVTHGQSRHVAGTHILFTGRDLRGQIVDNAPAEAPCIGSFVSRIRGANFEGLPPYVAVTRANQFETPLWLGAQYAPFETLGYPQSDGFRVQNVSLPKEMELDRLSARRSLLQQLDATRRIVDTERVADGMDDFRRQAFEMITGSRAREAFNIHAEDKRLRERYGMNHFGQCLLLARRLAESGVSFLTVRDSGWDHHSELLPKMKQMTPRVDQAIAALVEDLHERGLEKDILVVVTGEFGRTPKWNQQQGRDHWPGAMSVLLAGGGFRGGQVVGETTHTGEYPRSHAYSPQDLLATVYRHLGIDHEQTFTDPAGRPWRMLEGGRVIRELA